MNNYEDFCSDDEIDRPGCDHEVSGEKQWDNDHRGLTQACTYCGHEVATCCDACSEIAHLVDRDGTWCYGCWDPRMGHEDADQSIAAFRNAVAEMGL